MVLATRKLGREVPIPLPSSFRFRVHEGVWGMGWRFKGGGLGKNMSPVSASPSDFSLSHVL